MTAPVVLVSGAGGGIGAATVRRFAAGGWRIVAVDLDSQALDLLDSAPVIARLPGDVRTADACRPLVERAVAAAGRLDASRLLRPIVVAVTSDEEIGCLGAGALAPRLASLLAYTSLMRLRGTIDPRRVNGGVFLGLNGTVVKSHGSADATGVSAAIKLAAQLSASRFNDKLAARVAATATPEEDVS